MKAPVIRSSATQEHTSQPSAHHTLREKVFNLPTLLNNSAQHMTDIRRANGERTLSMLVLKIQVCPFQQQHAGHHSIRGRGQSLKFRHQFFSHLSEQNEKMKQVAVKKGRNPLHVHHLPQVCHAGIDRLHILPGNDKV